MNRNVYRHARIYLASSWKNKLYPKLLLALRKRGHEVYDFRNADSAASFKMKPTRTASEARAAIHAAPARAQLDRDLDAIDSADVLILVNPCGRSAHWEAGYAAGKGIRVVVLQDENAPDLLYAMADRVVVTEDELLNALDEIAWTLGDAESKVRAI